MTPGTAVNPSTAAATQNIKTFPLDVTDDEYVTVQVEFYVSTTTSSAIQDLPLILQIGANTMTVNVRPFAGAAALLSKVPYNLWLTAVSRSGDTVNVGLAQCGSAEAFTSVNVKVVAESGTRSGT
jgi:hypothetical protein